MNRTIPTVALLAVVMGLGLMPQSASAVTASQTITITATVAPARSIIVNDQGEVLSVISNTDLYITPTVYLGKMHGPAQLLTPELLVKYNEIIKDRQDLAGIEILVEPPLATADKVKQILFHSVSTMWTAL